MLDPCPGPLYAMYFYSAAILRLQVFVCLVPPYCTLITYEQIEFRRFPIPELDATKSKRELLLYWEGKQVNQGEKAINNKLKIYNS